MTPLERVTERAMRLGNPEDSRTPTPLLSLEEFFDGNAQVGSIGCNLPDEPAPRDFFEILSRIRARPDVSDVRIQITCMDDPGKEWPFSDTIWVMTSVGSETVRHWFPDDLAPDETWSGWVQNVRYEPYDIAPTHKPVGVWYD